MANTFTRLASANTYDNALRNLQARQTNLANLQENLTSGKKIVAASDDPTGAAQSERAMTRIARIAADQRALEAQKNSIAQAESTLGDMTDALQGIRELVVAAGNAAYTAPERRALVLQIQGLRDQVVALSNRTDTNGLPLFSALGSALAPISGPTAQPQDYTFQGLPGQKAGTEFAIPNTLDGDSAFMHQPARDATFNVQVTKGAADLIPNDRTLTTSIVSIANAADRATVQATSQATRLATTGPGLTMQDLPTYTVVFSAVVADPLTGKTTATYDITENPSVSGPIASGTAVYDTAKPTSIAIVGIPGLTLTVNGTPPITDKNNPTPTGSPAVGDRITIENSPSVFSVLDDIIRDIGDAGNINAASQAVSQALNNIDIGMARISAVRGQAGDLLNRADRITGNQEKRSIQLEADRSRAEDLDMIKGISDFQNQQTGYSAALQSYAQVQKLSLFNFIG